MDAGLRFNELLNQIENSKLNYVISRTPFSANISVKRSLIKFHDNGVSQKKEIEVNEEDQTGETIVLETKIANVLEQNAVLKELLEQKSDKVETLESELVNLQQELLKEKKDKNALAFKIKTHKKELTDLNLKSLEFGQTIKDLEDEVSEKAKTVKVKDAACLNFKKKKEESENRLNEVFNEFNSLKSETLLERKKISSILKCPFCDVSIGSRIKLSHHVKETHYTDIMCQTDDLEVNKLDSSDKCQPLRCEYNCFYCGYMINNQDNLRKHRTECREADFVVRDLKCDTSYKQTYSFPVLPPFQPSSNYPQSFSLPLEKCFTCNKEFQEKRELRGHFDSCHPDFIYFSGAIFAND